MRIANHHAHTRFSDGVGEPEEYVQAALAAGVEIYGFSDHAPFPEEDNFGSFDFTDLTDYVTVTNALRAEYAGKIELYRSLEVDYVPGEMDVNRPHLQAAKMDYTLGAVHFIGRLADGERWSFQRQDPIFQRGVDEIFGGSVQKTVEAYYALIREMIENHPTDIVAHLDRILKRNSNDRFWDRTAKWYRAAVMETLEAIAGAGLIMEVNTRGLYRGDNPTTYPDPWALGQALRLGIPVHLSSDAHAKDQIVGNFTEAAEVLLDVGYESVRIFSQGKWEDVGLTVPRFAAEALPEG